MSMLAAVGGIVVAGFLAYGVYKYFEGAIGGDGR